MFWSSWGTVGCGGSVFSGRHGVQFCGGSVRSSRHGVRYGAVVACALVVMDCSV